MNYRIKADLSQQEKRETPTSIKVDPPEGHEAHLFGHAALIITMIIFKPLSIFWGSPLWQQRGNKNKVLLQLRASQK